MRGKKWMALLLCASMLIGLAACGKAGVKEHTEHKWDASTGVCTVGGEACTHRNVKGKYKTDENGKCTICGYQSMFKWDSFKPGDELITPVENGGTIEKITYTSKAYGLTDTPEVTKEAFVYLPADYSTNKKYNVFYLMHGGGLSEIYWFAQGTEETGHTPDDIDYTALGNHTKDLLDNMMAKGLCPETIVVTPTFNLVIDGQKTYDVTTYDQELKNDLMPYIAEHYSTYAASGSLEDLIAARDHQAYAGLSMGSILGWNCILQKSVDVFGYIGNYSAGKTVETETSVYDSIVTALKGEFRDYKINYWYNGNGQLDQAHDGHVVGYDYMIEQCPEIFTNGYGTSGNATFVDLPQGVHGYTAWLTDLYNCMLVFFQR